MRVDHRREFSARLRRLMAERGLNPKSLLWMMGEYGKEAKVKAWRDGLFLPSCESLYALKRALGCTWEELLGEE